MEYNVRDYGAAGDGASKDRNAIQKAIDACSEAGGGRVVLPGGGTYMSGSLVLRSNVELYVESGAVLLFHLWPGRRKYQDHRLWNH